MSEIPHTPFILYSLHPFIKHRIPLLHTFVFLPSSVYLLGGRMGNVMDSGSSSWRGNYSIFFFRRQLLLSSICPPARQSVLVGLEFCFLACICHSPPSILSLFWLTSHPSTPSSLPPHKHTHAFETPCLSSVFFWFLSFPVSFSYPNLHNHTLLSFYSSSSTSF